MSMRFLHIKRAYNTEITHVYEVDRDTLLNIALLNKVYGEKNIHNTCAVTEEGEWLIQGRKVNPQIILQLYTMVFSYIHAPDSIYDAVDHIGKAHAQKYVSIYKATDNIVHHAERLEKLIQINQLDVKVAHQVHVDMFEYNQNFIAGDQIASKYIRQVFLPVEVLPSLYKKNISDIDKKFIAKNHQELSGHIETLRHVHGNITLRSHIEGETVYVMSLPNFRKEKNYVSMSLSESFQQTHISKELKKEIHNTVSNLAKVLFSKGPVVYRLKTHHKRGVFIQATVPGYCFVLHNPDFLFALSESHGVKVSELFGLLV